MSDPISKALSVLSVGMRPYIASRVERVLQDKGLVADIESWDAQGLLMFMWERWNDLFRHELSFTERSLISELRDFRNRWAHQASFDERDVYRVLEDCERLLSAMQRPEADSVATLRKESLDRLWWSEVGFQQEPSLVKRLWPHILCGASALAISAAIISASNTIWAWVLSGLITVALMRLAWLQAVQEARRGPGPRECSRCGLIIYSIDCPYCRPQNYPSNATVPKSQSIASAEAGKIAETAAR